MHRPLRLAASCCAALLCLTSCESDVAGPPFDPEVILIHPSSAMLRAGQSIRFSVTATAGQAGLHATEVAWRTSDARIAAVSADGTVSAGSPGTVRIQAWWNGKRGEATLVVLDAGKRHTICLVPVLQSDTLGDCRSP
jgi:uncharacterized protein YjdB